MLMSQRTTGMFDKETQLRTLYACVGASVVLHVLALAVFPGLRRDTGPASAKPLTAWFESSPAPETRPAARPPARVRPVLPPREPEAKRIEESTVALTPAPAAPVQDKVEPAASQSAIAEAPRPADQPALSPQLLAKSAVESQDDAALRRRYMFDLVSAAKRFMQYPKQARERGWEGIVEIRLVIDASGTIKRAFVKTSSRYSVLDEQALDLIRKAQPRPQIPPELRGREFSVDIPVVFELLTG